jgi:hypothetical protein
MSALVVDFPYRQASAHQRVPSPAQRSAEVIRFPGPTDSLTNADIDALVAATSGLKGRWRCETERDSNWGLSAIIVPSESRRTDYAAFLVCRIDSKLHLVDARLSAHWRTLGVFDHANDLALALQVAIG